MTRLIAAVGGLLTALAAVTATGQETPVYVDDSPIAWEMFREAEEQARSNVGEAVRLYQEVLDGFAVRLIHADSATQDRFQAARLRVLNALINDDSPGGLLQRHRIMEHAEAQRLHEAGDYDRLVLTRPWTEPGLDALLRVAQRHVESARFNAALAVLDVAVRHPDLPVQSRPAAHAWYMRAIATHFLGDVHGSAQAQEQLQRLVDAGQAAEALVAQLNQLKSDDGPEVVRGISPLDIGSVSPEVPLSELVAEEIWSVPLEATLYARRYNTDDGRGQVRRGRDQALGEGVLMTAAPTVVENASGGLVYVNQGHHIMALDRFTGSPMWPLVGGFVERPPLTIIDRDDDHARDLNIIAVQHDALVTLTGHAHATHRSNEGSVLCLDANTGEFRWSTVIDGISGPGIDSDEHQGLFPHSAPVIAEGRVYVLARKVSPQSLMSTYLVALDLSDGSLAWIRHIASSGSIRRGARSFSTLVYEGGDLYLSTAVGAVARIEASTGQMRWLHRFAVPLNPNSTEQTRRPWELTAPIITGNQVIALLPGVTGARDMTSSSRVLVLDRTTGHEVAVFDASQTNWNAPAYLLSAGPDSPWVYAVGRELRAFHVDALDVPVWSLPQEAEFRPLEIHGRVHVVEPAAQEGAGQWSAPALVVPSRNGVVIVDGASGAVINRLTLAGSETSGGGEAAFDSPSDEAVMAGNPVVVGSQLFIADNQHLRSCMAMSHAVGMLQQRIEGNPADPEPAMALLRLAIAAAADDNAPAGEAHLDLIVRSAEAVLRSMTQATSSSAAADCQSRLFSLLLAMDVKLAARDGQQGEVVFDLLRQVIAAGELFQDAGATHAQRVDYLLAYGDWLASDMSQASHAPQRAKAADAYQKVLNESDLADVRRQEGDVIRPAHAWARRRLAKLGESEDVSSGDLPIVRIGSPRLPRLGDQRGAAVLLDGALVQRSDVRVNAAAVEAADEPSPELASAMFFAGSSLSLHDVVPASNELAERWELNLATLSENAGGSSFAVAGRAKAQMWTLPEDRALVWIGDNRGGESRQGRFVMIQRDSGEALWLSPGVDGLFGEITQRLVRAASPSRGRWNSRPGRGQYGGGGEVFSEPIDSSELLPLVDRDGAYLVRRDGTVAAFNLEDGSAAAWVKHRVLGQVQHAALGDGVIVLSGISQGESGVGVGMAVLDAQTGEPLHGGPLSLIEGEEAARQSGGVVSWMTLDRSGVVVCATAAGVQAWDAAGGSFLWMNVSPPVCGSGRGWLSGEQVLVETRTAEVCRIDLHNALVTGFLDESPDASGADQSGTGTGVWGEVREVIVQHEPSSADPHVRTLVHYPRRVAWYSPDGETTGSDRIQDERNFRWVLPATDRVVVVSAHQPRQQALPTRPDGTGGGRRTQHGYSVYILSDNGRLLSEPLQLPPLFEPLLDAQLVDEWLLLSTSEHTVAVPFPVEG